ncbi:MAG: DinB family protein [Candidatus Korobacteraceae bacterium]
MNTADVHTLYAYNRWANRRMFSVLEKLSNEQFTATRQSSFSSVRESVLHIVAAEWIWLRRWKGNSPRATVADTSNASAMSSALHNGGVAVETLATLAGLQSFADSIEQERQEFLAGLTDDALQARLKYTDMGGKEFSMPLVYLLQHLVNHGTYHRGQVTTLLRQAGAETVAFDLLFFVREQEAGTP